ncbi:FtsB family cell division protein [Actinospica robiniae]|uniref:FtsB family cell division protein n=1 Tax=Actinospica robiniae TaxID=304901 RepID=UPI000686FB36|nr:septum formation initiator family protein [Actinospica robiniae]
MADQPRRPARDVSQRSSSARRTPSRLGLVPPTRAAEREPRERERQAEAEQPEVEPAKPRTLPRPSGRRPSVPRPKFRLTRRATILALAVCAVVVTVAYPFQEYLSQRSQLTSVERQNDALSKKVTELQSQIALWSDPGYVAIQARSQLHYVKPGEEGFTVAGPANGSEQLGLPTPTPSPWYDKLWNTVKDPGSTATR